MKKNFVRIVAALLVAMLALTLIPIGALAASYEVNIDGVVFDENQPEYNDDIFWYPYFDSVTVGEKPVTIKTSDYDSLIDIDGDLYDLDGLFFNPDFSDPDGLNETIKMHDSIKIPAFDGSDKWYEKYAWLYLGYVPHQHSLTGWISDGTTHWKNCTVCREKFIYQNWCQDGDEDGICNVCGGDVPYHDVTVIESEGGKITVNKDLASHRTKITADVEAADGYKLKKLHFIKVRDDGSEQEITRYKKDGQFWTRMPTYELKVTAEFDKK